MRVVVLDDAGRVLLLHIHEPAYRELGFWWELPGGGIKPGESPGTAAVRELQEETGIELVTSQLGRPTWRRKATLRRAGRRLIQDEVVLCARLHDNAPIIDATGQEEDEKAAYQGFRWWPIHEIESSEKRFYPSRMPQLLRRFLNGDEIDEPFEYFS